MSDENTNDAAATEGCAAVTGSAFQETLPLPSDLPESFRYATHADGTPALRVCLILGPAEAARLNKWFEARCRELKADKWRGWSPGDMALRTLCSQIDTFSRRAFGRRNA